MENNNIAAVNSNKGAPPAHDRGCTCIEALESLSKSDTHNDPDEDLVTYHSTGDTGTACEGTQADKWYCNRLPRSSAEFMHRKCEDIIDENGREYTVGALLNDLLLYMITSPNRWSEFMEASFSGPDTIEDEADTVDSDSDSDIVVEANGE